MFAPILIAEQSEPSFWASSAVIGAVLAGLGYVGKQLADLLLDLWRERKVQTARLVELRSLLRATRATFLKQMQLVQRLYASLPETGSARQDSEGYERTFGERFGEFTSEQKELHSVIRGMTEHSLRPLNLAISEWLKQDTTFKAGRRRSGPWAELACMLGDLEAHLVMWHAKYQAWIPEHENTAGGRARHRRSS